MDDATWKLVVDTAQTVAAFAGALSAIFAGWAIRNSSKDRKNAHLLNHAKISLERAFQALCGNTPQDSPPPHDRLGWLTAARLIEEYGSAKQRITDTLTRQECESYEEHWRHQFYVRLEAIQDGPASYFTPRPQGEEIQKTSAIVVHHFATWPQGKTDPLTKYKNADDAYEKLSIHLKWLYLRTYCGRG